MSYSPQKKTFGCYKKKEKKEKEKRKWRRKVKKYR